MHMSACRRGATDLFVDEGTHEREYHNKPNLPSQDLAQSKVVCGRKGAFREVDRCATLGGPQCTPSQRSFRGCVWPLRPDYGLCRLEPRDDTSAGFLAAPLSCRQVLGRAVSNEAARSRWRSNRRMIAPVPTGELADEEAGRHADHSFDAMAEGRNCDCPPTGVRVDSAPTAMRRGGR